MDLIEKLVWLEQEAAQFGFQWEKPEQIMDQIQSECVEVNEHLTSQLEPLRQMALQEEIGDLLHAVFSLCVFCHLNPRDTLQQTLNKFEQRLNAVKEIAAEQGVTHLKGHSFDALMQIWQQAKKRVSVQSSELSIHLKESD